MLIGSLELDGKPGQKSLADLNETFEKTLSKFSKFGKLAAGSFILTEAIEKVMHGFEGVLETGSRLNSMHLSTGESVHDLFIFEKALAKAGGSADIAGSFIFKLQNALAGVNEDNQKTAETFQILGINMKALKDAPILEQVSMLQKGLAGVGDQAQKVALVKNLFGFRFAGNALPLLTSPEALAGAMKGSEKMASLMDRNAHAFHDLELAIKGAKGNLTEFMAGALEVLAPNATELAKALGSIDFIGFGHAAGNFLNVMLELAKVMTLLGPLIQSVGNALGALNSSTVQGAGAGAIAGRFLGPGGMLAGGAIGALLGAIFGEPDKAKPQGHFAESFKGLMDVPKVGTVVAAGSLARVAGGGGFLTGGKGDPLLTEAQRHTAAVNGMRSDLQKFIESLEGNQRPPHSNMAPPV